MNNWISIKDRLPETETEILVYVEIEYKGQKIYYCSISQIVKYYHGTPCEKNCSSENQCGTRWDIMEGEKVLFWMPLPEKPNLD